MQPYAPSLRLLLLGQQRRLSGPRPWHGGRREGQERGLPDGQRRGAGRLGVAELKVEGRAGYTEGYTGWADDDGTPYGSIGGVGCEQGLSPAGGRGWGHGLAVGGTEVGCSEGGIGVRGPSSRH